MTSGESTTVAPHTIRTTDRDSPVGLASGATDGSVGRLENSHGFESTRCFI